MLTAKAYQHQKATLALLKVALSEWRFHCITAITETDQIDVTLNIPIHLKSYFRSYAQLGWVAICYALAPATASHSGFVEIMPSRYLKEKKRKTVATDITFTLFMLASKRSCCTTFFIATRLDELDIFYALSEKKSQLGSGCMLRQKAEDDHIRIPVCHLCNASICPIQQRAL